MVSTRTVFGENAAVIWDRNFQILFLANVFPSIGTAFLSPVLDALVGPFGTSSANVGWLISAYTAPGILIIPITGVIADRWGRKPVLVAGLLLFGIGGTTIAFTTDFRVALGLRFLQGIGFACLSPIIITSVGDIYHGAAEATAQGIRFTGSGLSQTVTPPIAGALVVVAWQYPFLLFALAIPVALVVQLWFDEPMAIAEPESSVAPDGGEMRDHLRRLRALVGHRRALALVIARCFPSVVWIGFLTYNSIIVVRLLDGTPIEAGMLAAIGSLFFSIAATQTGRVTATFETRFVPLLGASAVLGGGFVAAVAAPSVPVAGAAIAAVGSGFGLSLSLYRSAITGLAPPSLRGGLVSLAEAIGRLGSTLVPIVIGGIIAAGTPIVGFESAVRAAVVSVSVVVSTGSAVCLVVAYRAPPVEQAEYGATQSP